MAASPPAFTTTPEAPMPTSASRALAVAHPLTNPVGSTPPGAAHGSNHPSVSVRANRHRSSTTSISGGNGPGEPRRICDIGLCDFQVLNTASARINVDRASAKPTEAPHKRIDTTVPITSIERTITPWS